MESQSPSLCVSSASEHISSLQALVRSVLLSAEADTQHPAAAVLDPSLFYTLEPPTFTAIMHCLTQYYAGHSSGSTGRRHMEVVQRLGEAHPSSFSFRYKPNTTAAFSLPHGPSGEHWSVAGNIGRGTYGHALLVQRRAGGQERRVFKVDTCRDSVLWEAFVHMQVCTIIYTAAVSVV